MGLIKSAFTAIGVLATAAVIPFKVEVKKEGDEENQKKNVTVEALAYRLDVKNPGEDEKTVGVNLTLPSPTLQKAFDFFREKSDVVKEKAVSLKDKAVDLYEKAEEKIGSVIHKDNGETAEDLPDVEITIEVPAETVEEEAQKPLKEEPAPAKKTRKKKTEPEA